MFHRALSIGGPGTERIQWESAHDCCARRMRAQIDRIVQSWGDQPKRKINAVLPKKK
jgi:hypothetical protein